MEHMLSFQKKKGVEKSSLYQGLAQPTSDNNNPVHALKWRAQTSVVLTKLTFREVQVLVSQLSQGCQKLYINFFLMLFYF